MFSNIFGKHPIMAEYLVTFLKDDC